MILRTLGGLTLDGAGFRRPKPLLLLVYLAVEGSTERRYLAELFWPRAANARRSLTTALTQVRAGAPDAVGANDVRVWCNVESDAMQILRAVEDREWLRAVELFRGPFLEGVELGREGVELEEWMYATRERMAHGMRTALLALGEQAASDDRFDDAGMWAGRAHALSDSAPPEPRDLGRLYRLLLASNRPDLGPVRREAVALGLDVPSTVADARSSVRADAATNGTHHLPVPANPFIGRSDELDTLTQLVTDDRSRLLSLVGPGGIGNRWHWKDEAGSRVRPQTVRGGLVARSVLRLAGNDETFRSRCAGHRRHARSSLARRRGRDSAASAGDPGIGISDCARQFRAPHAGHGGAICARGGAPERADRGYVA